ncbi:hypothetical protein ES702_00266 [subsurface metagenome]
MRSASQSCRRQNDSLALKGKGVLEEGAALVALALFCGRWLLAFAFAFGCAAGAASGLLSFVGSDFGLLHAALKASSFSFKSPASLLFVLSHLSHSFPHLHLTSTLLLLSPISAPLESGSLTLISLVIFIILARHLGAFQRVLSTIFDIFLFDFSISPVLSTCKILAASEGVGTTSFNEPIYTIGRLLRKSQIESFFHTLSIPTLP